MTRLTIDSNEVYGNNGPGLWCDGNCVDVTFSNNRVHHNARAGIFFEISDGAQIHGNAVWENGWTFTTWGWGAGILISSSSNAEVFDNTVAWNGDGISVISQNRGHSTLGNHVHDNVIVGVRYTTLLGFFQDWAGVLTAPASDNWGANNVYWLNVPDGTSSHWEWAGSGRFARLVDWNATPGEENGRYLNDSERDLELGTPGIPLSPERFS